ncbi:phage tail tube protein [Leptospira sp. 96542]|nr:phage tail tube protein [Leptospira sp. 96542]
MSRYIRKTVILAKLESVYGTDPTPTGTDNALLVSNVSISAFEAQTVDRELIRPHFGASEQLIGPVNKTVSFDVELAGSGAADTAPAWGPLLQACAFGEDELETPDRVEYLPITDALPSITLYYYDDGVLHKLLGARGTFTLSARVGEIPKLSFTFTGVDGGDTAAANSSATLTAWKKPVVMAKANVVDITLGCSYAAGALSGGTVYSSTGLELDTGNEVNFNAMLNAEDVDISNRAMSGSTELDLSAAQEVSFMATVKAATTQGLGLTIGTTSGNKIILFAPAAQLLTPSKAEMNGRRLIGFDLRLCPSASGNDELRIVTL